MADTAQQQVALYVYYTADAAFAVNSRKDCSDSIYNGDSTYNGEEDDAVHGCRISVCRTMMSKGVAFRPFPKDGLFWSVTVRC